MEKGFEEKHEKIQQLIKRYVEKVGLGNIQPKSEVEKFLNISQAEIRRMSDEECGEASVILNQEATYVQLEINRLQADLNWCNGYIEFIIANNIDNTGGKYTPYEYRRVLAIKENDVAVKVQKIINNIKLQIDAIHYIPNHLECISKSFEYLQNTKNRQKN